MLQEIGHYFSVGPFACYEYFSSVYVIPTLTSLCGACIRVQLMTRILFFFTRVCNRSSFSHGSVGQGLLVLRFLLRKHKHGWVHNFNVKSNWCGHS